MKLLKEIPSLVNAVQGNKILQKVNQLKADGAFKTEEEYQEELKRQMIQIAGSQNKPIYSYAPIMAGAAHSEYINKSMEDIVIDLNVLFSEISYLFSKIKSHEIFFDRSVEELLNLTNRLEKELEAAQIEAGLDNVYNKVVYNSFLDASTRLSLINKISSEMYYDNRIENKVDETELAEINTTCGTLELPTFKKNNIKIANIDIVSTETTVSEYDIQLPSNSTDSLTSDKKSEIWSYHILTRNRLKDPAKLSLEVDLGDKQEINNIFLSPNTSVPVLLDSIKYEDEGRNEKEIEIDSSLLTEDRMFVFPSVIARRLKITFKQDRSDFIPLSTTQQWNTLDDIHRDPSLNVSLSSIESNIKEQIKDPSIKGILGLNGSKNESSILLNKYSFSFNSIKVGMSDYQDIGYFVSKQEKTKPVSIIAIETNESIDTLKHPITGKSMPSGSIEYDIIKRDYSKSGQLLSSTVIPVVKTGTNIINGEMCPFAISKTITTRFKAHSNAGDGTAIKVFRNGEELIRGVDWFFPDRKDFLNKEDGTIKDGASSTRITIAHSEDQIKNGIYYVEYIPAYALDGEAYITSEMKYLPGCTIRSAITYYGQEIAYSDFYIKITLRSFNNSGKMSPIVDFYRLLLKEELNEQ